MFSIDHIRTPNDGPKQRMHAVLLTFLLVAFSSVAFASDTYQPILESLQIVQKQAAQKAAPSGHDQTQEQTGTEFKVEVDVDQLETTEDLSTLAEQALEKVSELSLQEERQTQALDIELEQFGYDIFSYTPDAFTRLENVPVPRGYRVGAGDSLVVQIYGKRNVEYNLVVTREGQVLIPEFGPVQVAGLSFEKISELITANFAERVIGATAVVTMGKLRSMQIRLAGDVNRPGVYTVNGLATLIDALLTSGGVKYSGSLRNIQVKRYNKTITRFDLYSLLLKGETKGDVTLQHNDVIFVPPIGDVVTIGGEVQRPGIYEIRNEKSIPDVIKLAGGLLANASLENSHVERIVAGRYRSLINAWNPGVSKSEQKKLQQLTPGDFVRILPMDETLDGVVLLQGKVKRPGGYQFRSGMRLSDLIANSDALLPGADLDFAMIQRESQDGRTEVVYTNLGEALSKPDSTFNMPLQSRDQIMVFDLQEWRANTVKRVVETIQTEATDVKLASIVNISGNVRYSGIFPLQANSRLLDVLPISGGIKSGTDLAYGVITSNELPSKRISMRSFSLAAAVANPHLPSNPRIQPGDRIYLFDDTIERSKLMAKDLEKLAEQAAYTEQEQLIRINGRVLQEGLYPLESGMRASDLLCAASGVDKKGDGLRAELSRYHFTNGEVREVTHIDLNATNLIRLCSARQNFAYQNKSLKNNDLHPHMQYVTHKVPENVSLEWVKLYLDDESNPILQANDQLTFAEKSGWSASASVVLSGEVTRPGLYVIKRGETLCEVLKRADGLTPEAYPYGAEFKRNSIREIQQETLDSIQAQLDDLLVDLSISHSVANDQKTPVGKNLNEQLRVIKQLQRAKPSGRMVIDLENAQRCRKKARVVLEDGDELHVPRQHNQVYVTGQVYVPTTHRFQKGQAARDYIALSGGSTVLGRYRDSYVIQANGEVLGVKKRRRSKGILNSKVHPGAKIVVPLNVDRMNTTEKAQSWTRVFLETAILAGVIL